MVDMNNNSEQSLSPDIFDRYLGILGVSIRKPSYDALAELVYAHMTRIPFENLSKIYRTNNINLRDLPGLELYLDGIESCNFGGTCYTSNNYFYTLLRHLGYKVMLCGADMSNPDSHLIIMVTVDEREYLVDTGYAAPFIKPLPRDLDEDYVVQLGRDRYVLHPQDQNGCSRLDLYRDDNLRHGYLAKPIHRNIEHFADRINESFGENSTFMNSLLMVRLNSDSSVAIHNFSVIRSHNKTSQITEFSSREELASQIEITFNMPHDIISDVVSSIDPNKSAWS
jgi:arylamine N-acetyltransferase